jgi:hypothetical protein
MPKEGRSIRFGRLVMTMQQVSDREEGPWRLGLANSGVKIMQHLQNTHTGRPYIIYKILSLPEKRTWPLPVATDVRPLSPLLCNPEQNVFPNGTGQGNEKKSSPMFCGVPVGHHHPQGTLASKQPTPRPSHGLLQPLDSPGVPWGEPPGPGKRACEKNILRSRRRELSGIFLW